MQVKHLLLITILTLTTAYSPSKETVDENLNGNQLYQQAQDDLNNKSCDNTVTKLKVLESYYPFSRYAEQIQLGLIYANYRNMEPEAARAAAERFIRLHPQHPSVDYTYYLKDLSFFDQDRGLLVRFLPLDMTKRDPGTARDFFNGFVRFTSRFPNSCYVLDTRARMVCLHNLLAAYEVHVGHYYPKRQTYVVVASRGHYVMENFQETPVVGDGLAIMVEAYRRLGLDDPASTSLETLKLNYPDNVSLKDDKLVAREGETDARPWLTKATLDLIEGGESPPYIETQAAKDVIKQYEDTERGIPVKLKPESQDYSADGEEPKSGDDEDSGHSWRSYMAFGLFN